MKFSDFTQAGWEENSRFYDTCLLPYTGLTGTESPPETAGVLEKLRDLMDLIEKPFQGRLVTYPAIQYQTVDSTGYVNEICRKVKSKGFQYVIVVTAEVSVTGRQIYESDLVLSLPELKPLDSKGLSDRVRREIQEMWQAEK